MLRLLEALAARDGRALIDEARAMSERNIALDSALQELGVALHDIALLQTVPDAVADDHPDRERLASLARTLDPETIQLYYQIAVQGRTDLPLAPDEFAGFSMTLLRMLAFAPVETRRAEVAMRRGPRALRSCGRRGAAVGGKHVAERSADCKTAASADCRVPVARPRRRRPAAAVSRRGPAPQLGALRLLRAIVIAAIASAAQAGASSNAAARASLPAKDASACDAARSDRRRSNEGSPTGPRGLRAAGSTRPRASTRVQRRAQGPSRDADGHRGRARGAENQRHLAEKMHQDKLKDALAKTLGVPVRLSIEIGGGGESSVAAADRRARAEGAGRRDGRASMPIRSFATRCDSSTAACVRKPYNPSPEAARNQAMMKGGIAGLMQQAQKMQENMQKAQEELAQKEVEGQAGAGMVKVTMTGKSRGQARADRSEAARRGSRHARGPGGGGDQRCGASRRDDDAGIDGRAHRRHAAAAGDEAAVLSRSVDFRACRRCRAQSRSARSTS